MLRSLLSVLVVFCLAPVDLAARSASSAQRDSIKQVIADHRSRIHLADSTGDVRASLAARIELAPLVGTTERLRLLEEAAAGAHAAALLEDEVMARKLLAAALADAGKHAKAFEEAMHVAALDEVRLSEQLLRSNARGDSAYTAAVAEKDSLEQIWRNALQETSQQRSETEAAAERWMFIALGLGVLAVAAILFVALRSGARIKQFRSELKLLRAEVQELRKPRNVYRQAEPAPVPDAAPAPSAPPPPEAPARPVFDATALAFFKRMAPERLTALHEARARGDHDKAMRVVHTLKPHLEALDPQDLGALCVRLRTLDPVQDPAAWQTGLDRLERGVSTLLA